MGEIRLNYYQMDENLLRLQKACANLDKLKEETGRICGTLDGQEGKAISQLRGMRQTTDEYIAACRERVAACLQNLDSYKTEMEALIPARDCRGDVRVDAASVLETNRQIAEAAESALRMPRQPDHPGKYAFPIVSMMPGRQHYVLVTGVTNDGYRVMDPANQTEATIKDLPSTQIIQYLQPEAQ